jgi:hypothetical protein
VNLFDFVDRSSARVFNGGAYWHHQLKPRISLITNYSFNWQRKEATTNFENRENVSGDAGIGGNDQDPANWGPPSLGFSSGFFGLSDGNSSEPLPHQRCFSVVVHVHEKAQHYRGRGFSQAGLQLVHRAESARQLYL